MSRITLAHFKSTPAQLLAMLATVDIGINPQHAVQESDHIWRVQMHGANSIPEWGPTTKVTSRIDFWLGEVVKHEEVGGQPVTVDRGRHVTMRVWGPRGGLFRERLLDAYTAPGVVNVPHDTPAAMLAFYGVSRARWVRTVEGCSIIHVTPPDDYEQGTGPIIMQDVYSRLANPVHEFA